MKLYSIGVAIGATAYIKAESEEEAQAKADALRTEQPGVEISSRYQPTGDDDICFDGRSYQALAGNSETVAFSPAMTIQGPEEGERVEFVEEIPDA